MERTNRIQSPATRRPAWRMAVARRGYQLVASLLALAALIGAGPVPSAAAEGVEVSEARTDQYPRVIVRFAANLEDGTPITDIKPGQLLVWENGQAQEQVDLFSLRESSAEVWISLVMDVSGSMNDEDRLNQAKQAAKAFVARLRSKDRTSIVTFSDKVLLQQQPTGDPGVLGRAIDALQAKGPTRLYDGLERGIAESLRARQGARRAVVLLSDGDDTDSVSELDAVLQPAIEHKIPVYTIGLGTESQAEVLTRIAAETRGRYYAAPTAGDLHYVFQLLSGQLSSQYEAWWASSTEAPSGSQVNGRLVLELPGRPPLETSFSYVMPVFMRPAPRTEAAVGVPLQEVQFASTEVWDLPEWWPLAAAALAALGMYVAFFGVVVRVTKGRIQERIQHFVGSYHLPRNRLMQLRQSQSQSLRPMVIAVARLSHRMMPTRMLDALRHQLVLAGLPSGWHFSKFLAAKLLLAVGGACAGYAIGLAREASSMQLLAQTASAALAGYYLPHPWLKARIKARQKAIQRALPDALDLMTVGVGAGLSLDGAILEIVEKSDNPLSRELANFLAEMRMGRSRREALQGLQARTEVEDIKVLVASLLQAEELGMSLSETLVIQADQMRLRRRQRAEELAHKATVKMLIPMVLLIFPALFVVIMGPAVPDMLEFLGQG